MPRQRLSRSKAYADQRRGCADAEGDHGQGHTQGGRYAHPSGPKNVAAAGLPADPDFDPSGLMNKPGFKVMHVQDVDYRSTCQPFIGCLEQIKEWSHAHPNHVPIFVLVETKQDKPGRENKLHLTETEPFTAVTETDSPGWRIRLKPFVSGAPA